MIVGAIPMANQTSFFHIDLRLMQVIVTQAGLFRS